MRLADDRAIWEGVSLLPRWRVDIIRKRAEHLGTVEAATEKEAIEKAAERFEIQPERRNRIAVQKVGKHSGNKGISRVRTTAPSNNANHMSGMPKVRHSDDARSHRDRSAPRTPAYFRMPNV